MQGQTGQLANQRRSTVHRADSPCRAVRVRVLCCQEGQEDRFRGAQVLSTQRKGRRTAVLGSGITDGGDSMGIRALFKQGGVGSASRWVRLLLSVGGSVP